MDLYRAHVTPVQFMAKNMSRFILKKQETDLDLWPVRKYCKIGETLARGALCINDDKSFSNKCYNCITYKTKLK